MPLTLVTGPANAEKAGAVLDWIGSQSDREPILVVPTRADVNHYRRELAVAGRVMGPRVERFDGLIDEAAQRCATGGRPLGAIARERVAAAAIARTELRVLAEPARSDGFARALVRLVAELEAARIDPPRLTQALRTWAGAGPRRDYAEEVAALYAAYRRQLERLGRTDAELRARGALDALRLAPAAWRATPVAFYGFDDLTALELDAIETLARIVDAPVIVSLAYEAGRLAFAGRAGAFEDLRPLAAETIALPASDAHYDPRARAALHALERRLFEPAAGAREPGPAAEPAGVAIELLEGGGERAELELVAAELRKLLAGGIPAQEIAVATRSPAGVAPLIEEVFDAAGIPYALARPLRFADTALGRGALALLRLALLDGDAADLVAWLRTPGVVERIELVDALERATLRGGLDRAGALATWERLGWRIDAIARLREAATQPPPALCDALLRECDLLFARPRRRAAAVLDADERDDARALAALRRALAELGELARVSPRLAPGPAELAETLAGLELAGAGDERPGAVLVTDPLALRARRVRVLIVCRLQEGLFPQQRTPPPFFSERDRRDIAAAAGLALPAPPDWLHAERYLFYATVSRASERLVLSWHAADDDGGPAQRSLFVDDVCDLFGPELLEQRRHRSIAAIEPAVAAVDAAPGGAAAPGEAFAPPGAVAPLRSEAVLEQLRSRGAWSPSSLERWARCPVRWLLERHAGAQDLEPEPEPLVRGRLVHDVLRATSEQLIEQRGSARIDAGLVETARALLRDALEQLAPRYRVSVNAERLRAAVREVQLDLERHLDHCVRWGGTFEPRHFELEFGWGEGGRRDDGDPANALALADGRLRLHGRIDRVDEDGAGRAIVYDYKGRSVEKAADWVAGRTLQLPLYMLAAEQLLGVEAVGGFYQPIGAPPALRRARGIVAADAGDELECVRGDRRDPDEVRALLDEVVALAVTAFEELERGALESRPSTCDRDGICAHPSICRLEVA